MEEQSLGLDIETLGYGGRSERLARVAVVGTRGCTRDGSAVTITRDCRTPAALAREVARIRAELDRVLEEGTAALGGAPEVPATPPGGADSEATAKRSRPQLEADAVVADLMTREVRSIAPNDPLARAKAAMDAGRFRHVVVLDEQGELVGVLSQRDLSFGPLAWSLGQGEAAYETLLEATPVKQAMRSDVATVDSHEPLATAASLLLERQIGCLPVMEAERLVGLVTESDLLGLFRAGDA